MIFLLEYGVQADIRFPVIKRAVVDFAVSADWTPAAADARISKDGGNLADCTNTIAIVGGTGTVALWKLTLAAAELQCKEAIIQIVDAATKAIEDQMIAVYTVGHPSAKYIVNPFKPRGLVSFVVGNGSTPTSIVTSAMVPAASAADQFKGRVVIFDDNTTTAALRGQATVVATSTSGGVLTVGALTTSPVNGDVGYVY